MLTVAGGTYFEFCVEPRWEQLWGSGGRAATAVSGLCSGVELFTYVGEAQSLQIASIAASNNFSIRPIPTQQTISFRYFHGLTEPKIWPTVRNIQKCPAQSVVADNILRFGVLEGDFVVCGERVVYDPQDAYNPRPFHENGSSAKRLAVVANTREASFITGSQETGDHIALAKALLDREQAEVVVLKRGGFGATVVTPEQIEEVPAYKTETIWPIGSGDVFAAAFAYHWAVARRDPFTSARSASLSAAYYCGSNALPIPLDLEREFSPSPIVKGAGNFPLTPKQVYLAGPFFTMAQRWVIEQSRLYLRDEGFKVFSPYHDVGLGTAAEVAPKDIEALKKSDLMFAIADGLDAGTLYEIGYARAINKPVIVFVQNESSDDLKMLEGTQCEIINDFVSAIYRTTWAAIEL